MKTSKFKMTEIGEIPADWEVKKLGECCINFNYGVGAEAIPYVSGRKYIRITDIDERSRKYKPDVVMASAFETDNSIVNDGDILVARTGASVGKSYCYDSKDGELVFAGFLMRFHPENINSKYVFLTTLIGRYAQWVASESARSGQPGINIQQLKSYQIPVPPLAEQKAIAEALSDVDELLAAMTTLIEKKRAIKQGAMQELLGMRNCEVGAKKVPRRRLPGFSGEWVEKQLGDCGAVIRGVSYKPYQSYYESGCRRTMLLRSNNIKENVLNFDDLVYVDDECIGEDQLMRCGDILICAANGSRKLVGKSAILKKIDKAISFGAFMAIFRTNSNSVDSFVGYLLQSESYRKQLDDILTGSAINNLNARDILSLLFFMPPTLAEQRAIAEVLSDMDAEIEALEAKRAKYESIKQSMMQELLTGKTRLV